MFIKVQVSSIFKGKNIRVAWVKNKKNRIRIVFVVVFAVHHLHHTTALQEIFKPLEISA